MSQKKQCDRAGSPSIPYSPSHEHCPCCREDSVACWLVGPKGESYSGMVAPAVSRLL